MTCRSTVTVSRRHTREYWKDELLARGYRERASNLDIGAYESTTSSPAQFW